jgi:hypothetical protein
VPNRGRAAADHRRPQDQVELVDPAVGEQVVPEGAAAEDL